MLWIDRASFEASDVGLLGAQGHSHLLLTQALTLALSCQLANQPPSLDGRINQLGELRIHRGSLGNEFVQIVSRPHVSIIHISDDMYYSLGHAQGVACGTRLPRCRQSLSLSSAS